MPPPLEPFLPNVIIRDEDGNGYLEVPRDSVYSSPVILGHTSSYIWDVYDELDKSRYNRGTVESSDSDRGQYDDIALDRFYDNYEKAQSEQSIRQDWPLADELEEKRLAAMARVAKLHEKRLRRQEKEDGENRRVVHG